MKLPIDLTGSFLTQFETAKTVLAPYTKRVYLVGGSVRDLYLNAPLHDLDIEVYDMAPDVFDDVMKRMGAVGVGKSFYVYKWGVIDFSLPRVERKSGVGHSAFEVDVCQDEKEASKRRDFSMNAMMVNIFTQELFDFWGGVQAIEKKRLAIIDEQSFQEDSLRVLRAMQFSARLGFKIESKSLKIMQEISLADLSKPRILWEFEKLFSAPFLHIGLFYMYQLCLFEKCFTCKVENRFFEIARELIRCKHNFQEELLSYYFVYIVANRLGQDPLVWLNMLDAPNHYRRLFRNQPFVEGEISDEMLLHVSLDMPLCEWLGHYQVGVKERALDFGIWEKPFDGGISVYEVMGDGFEGRGIGEELRKRRMKKIQELCEAE
ncbi:CCA tRNA nucleotidyltransferase [Sulfurospirillum barnesii]|uniref:tRNA nucleotidyltransferase/poly(A) polymerase n=1 Tax=Sulfurospirillum barnesii (strain ATCC 700032 / DSM 10660 / SES-3) TaxID=760154 RepID=I3XY24_SULBS|nr:CCA tRNA nucleotidyltransferase [Sulfurospirillum barnesii]AFL68848.1 tRNA nucleotidyltransferase/poly(A) polymerase [Sulfurospirillum barnesii SES-3]